jgi:uncharacterized protein YaiE (UPF0345 family)
MFDVNEYYEGKVKSIAFEDPTSKATIGVMAAGNYEFGTSTKEVMTVISGQLKIKFPDSDEWKTYSHFETFEIKANVNFLVEVFETSTYICRYY